MTRLAEAMNLGDTLAAWRTGIDTKVQSLNTATSDVIASCEELKGGPHGVLWTSVEEINTELVKFPAKLN